jgi:hypothetical protein
MDRRGRVAERHSISPKFGTSAAGAIGALASWETTSLMLADGEHQAKRRPGEKPDGKIDKNSVP